AVAAGKSHACALLADGTVRCWGNNDFGQLGNTVTTPQPVPVVGLTNAVAIAAGPLYTCALLADGTVRCWGDNYFGQLGTAPTDQAQFTPVTAVGVDNAVAIIAGGFPGSQSSRPSGQTCALLADGDMHCWGDNASGQLSTGGAGS